MSIGLSELIFICNEFRYDISYTDDDVLRIDAIHVTEALRWATTITNRLSEGSSEHIKVSFTPKNLIRLFSHFMRGDLSDRHKIVMPETYTYRYDDPMQRPLQIEIHSTMEYQDEWDVKYIQLSPIYVSIQERFDLKLAQRDKLIQALNEKINKLELAQNIQNVQNVQNIDDAAFTLYTTTYASHAENSGYVYSS